jgi:ubiquinone/menaquinone biosynthesis C-methylase UbiE
MGPLETAAWGAGTALKTAWYAAHYLHARRVSGPYVRPGDAPPAPKGGPVDMGLLRRAFFDVHGQDRANVAKGLYPAPAIGPELARLRAAPAYVRDLRALDERRLAGRATEVRDMPESASFPAYYRQNFHWQSDGWLSEASASIYEFQVETIFTGAAAMRRTTALALMAEAMAGRDQRGMRHLELACGAGGFAAEIARAWPRLDLTALDLSPAYAARAARALAGRSRARAVVGLAERLPFADASLDVATCVYLFHELPPRVREAVTAEAARVIRPGGVFILADALRRGDDPNLDRLLEAFPIGFHEPYFTSWLDLDVEALFAKAGFEPVGSRQAFLTRGLAFRRRG